LTEVVQSCRIIPKQELEVKMKHLILICFILALFLTPDLSHSEQTILRCNHNKIIRINDYKTEVLQKCGEPFFREENHEINQWSYKLGLRGKVWVVVFSEGKVKSIDGGARKNRAGPGKAEKESQIKSDFKKMLCGREFIKLGDYKAFVLKLCGEPFLKEENRRVNQWSYQSGPENTLYVIRFDKGRVKGISKGQERRSKASLAGHK